MVEINRREHKPRPPGPGNDSKLRSHSLHNSNMDIYANGDHQERKVVYNQQAPIATLEQDMLPSQQWHEAHNTRGGMQTLQHSRISTQRMLSHFKVNSLAQAQMSKIEGLLRKARGRHGLLATQERYDKGSSALARIASEEDGLLGAEFENVDVRRSLQVNAIKHDRALERSKRHSPSQTSSIPTIAAAVQSFGSHGPREDKEVVKFHSMVPTLRSSFQVPLHNNQQLSSHRLGGFSEYSTSGLPQKGTDRASMLGRTMEGKPSGARFKNSPLLKDVLLKDEPKMTAPKKLKPIHAHLRLSLQERKQLAKERLQESQKKLPKFHELSNASFGMQKKALDLGEGRRNASNIAIKLSNRYDGQEEESQRKSNMALPTHSQTLLVSGDSPMLSKQASASMIILNQEDQLAATQSTRKLERIISLQSFVQSKLEEQHEYAKQRQASLDSLHSGELSKRRANYQSRLLLSQNTSMASLESMPSAKNLSPQAKKDIETSLKVNKSQEKITFRDFALPPQHGRKRLPERVEQPPRPEDIISQKLQTNLGRTEKKTGLGDEVNQKVMKSLRTKGIDVWKLPMGHRNKLMSENIFASAHKKEHNMQKATDVTGMGRNPLAQGSFEGVALRQAQLRQSQRINRIC